MKIIANPALDSIYSSRQFLPIRLVQAIVLMIFCLGLAAHAQGTFVSDPAIPALISPSSSGSEFFILNQDLSLLTHSTQYTTAYNCAAPSGFTASSSTPRTLLNDGENAYFTAQSSTSANAAATAIEPDFTCASATPFSLAGGTPTGALSSNDPGHGRYFVVSAFSGAFPDLITVINNLNTNSTSTPTLTQQARTALDTNGQYTSIVTDVHSGFGLTAITELKTATSPGNLWVYSPGINTAFKILGPGGVPLPALGAFIIPAKNNANGDLLVLINQDSLTTSNLASPPQDTAPFTIIDLGQLQRTFSAVVASGNTITLPYVTQIHATTPYYAMLGAAYNPINHLLYALVGGGSSTSSVTENIITYDPTNPSAPNETIVADVSTIPFTFGAFPQLALNASSGTLQILSGSPAALFTVAITGTGNTATMVTGSPFPDSNFMPTFVTANPLLGETYIASSSGQVDILTLPTASSKPHGTIELYGTDNAIANQNYTLYTQTINPNGDSDLTNATVTFTATPAGGAAYTLTTAPFYNFAGTNGNVSATFPSAGVYTIVASVPATTNYPAITSLPLVVTVGATGVAGVYPTTLALSVPATSSSTTVTATATLSGSTYGPTGRIVVKDATNSEVGRYTLTGAAVTFPVNITLTLPNGASTLTATYNGDDQNQTSTSPSANITVGTVAKVTPTIALTLPTSATAGGTATGTVSLFSSSTTAPTGNITIYAIPSGTSTQVTLATVPAAQAFASGGKTFTFTAPPAGNSSVYASYDGDTNYDLAFSPTYTEVTTGGIAHTTLNISAPASVTAATAFITTVTLGASTTPTSAVTGSVTITATPTAGGSAVTLATVPATQAYVSGGKQVSVTIPTAGSYILSTNYAGDANYAAASGSIGITVTAPKETPTLSLSLTATATAGGPVVGTSVPTFPGTATPTGNIIVQATSSTGTVTPLFSYPASNARTSLVTLVGFNAPAAGTYTLQAVYAGDTNFNAAQSPSMTLTVLPAGPIADTLTLTAPTSVLPNTNFKIHIVISPQTATPITGDIVVTARFTRPDGSGGSPDLLATIPASQAATPAGTTIAVQLSSAGHYIIGAGYDGDANYAHSGMNVETDAFASSNIRIDGPGLDTGTTASAGLTNNYTVTISTLENPTGNITLTTALGSTPGPGSTFPALAALNGTVVPLVFSTPGNYVMKATYAGDTNTGPSTISYNLVIGAAPVTPTFQATLDDPSVSGTFNSLHISHGAQANVGITLKAFNGYSTFVNLTMDQNPKNALILKLINSTGATVTGATPVAAGAHLTLVLSYNPDYVIPQVKNTSLSAIGLLAITFLFIPRRLRSKLRATSVLGVFFLVLACTFFTGCSTLETQLGTVTLHATPASGSLPAQDIPINYSADR